MPNKPKADLIPLREVAARLLVPGGKFPLTANALRLRLKKLGIVPQRLSPPDGGYPLNYITPEEGERIVADFKNTHWLKFAKVESKKGQ